MAKILAKKEPKFLKCENFVNFCLECEIQRKKTKLLLIKLFSKVAFSILAKMSQKEPKLKSHFGEKLFY